MFKTIATAAVTTAALMAASNAVQASDNSDTLKVQGNVAAVCTVDVEDYGVRLDLVKGADGKAIGEITETCNDADGYTITLASSEGGNMVNGKAKVAYTIDYDTVSGQSLGKEQSLTRKSAAYGDAHELAVNIDGDFERVAGAYADTITVTIAAN